MSYSIRVTSAGASRRADKSVGLRYVSELEISPSDLMKIDEDYQQEGMLTFSTDGTAQPLATDSKPAGLTRSQKIRYLIEQLAEKQGKDPKEEYDKWTSKVIEALEAKLQ